MSLSSGRAYAPVPTPVVVRAKPLRAVEKVPTSVLSEDTLIAAGLGLKPTDERCEACVCGGVIRAVDDDQDIASAVRVHNLSTRHARTMEAMGWR